MSLTGARILVIDDHPELVENLREILEEEGALVRHASSGAEAEEVAADPFDVALLDVRLPDATGLEVLPRLRRAGDGAGEVLLITGDASLEDAMEAVRIGAYAYLLKPFDPDDLLRSVGRAVRQVRSTRERDALVRAVEERELRLRTLVDTVQALLVVLDSHGRVVLANHAAADCTGRTVDALVGVDWMAEFVPESDRADVRRVFQRLVSGESPVSHENRILRTRPEGGVEERWVSWRSSALFDGGEAVVYASGIDTTEVRAMEQRTRLAEKLAAVGTLSAGLAHEIRNPLNAASLQLRVLERRCRDLHGEVTPLLEPIHLVQQELQRLSRLVGDFLQFARPAHLERQNVDLVSLVRHIEQLERPIAGERGVELTVDLAESALHLFADGEKISQVLHNLLRNAFEALEGRPAPQVEIHLAKVARGARIAVVDNGPGIPEKDLDRIFEPFFSTRSGGTGLGMAIVHNLVEAHGGTITVSNNGGTRVEIELPTASR